MNLPLAMLGVTFASAAHANDPVCARWSAVGAANVAGAQKLVQAAAPVWGAPLVMVPWKELAPAAHEASTVQRFHGRPYAAAHAFDGKLTTAWVEDAEGLGEGEWVEIHFDARSPLTVHGAMVVPGFARNASMFRNNPRPAELALALSCARPERAVQCMLQPADQRGPQLFRFVQPVSVEQRCRLRLTLGRSHRGDRFADGSISEVWLVGAR